jgi:hypothetical protein
VVRLQRWFVVGRTIKLLFQGINIVMDLVPPLRKFTVDIRGLEGIIMTVQDGFVAKLQYKTPKSRKLGEMGKQSQVAMRALRLGHVPYFSVRFTPWIADIDVVILYTRRCSQSLRQISF